MSLSCVSSNVGKRVAVTCSHVLESCYTPKFYTMLFSLNFVPKRNQRPSKPSSQECFALSQIGYIATSEKIEQLIHHYFSGISLFYNIYIHIDNNIVPVWLNTVILYLCHSGARLEASTSSTAADFLPPLKKSLKKMKVLSGIIIIHPIFRNRPCWRMHIKKAWCASLKPPSDLRTFWTAPSGHSWLKLRRR